MTESLFDLTNYCNDKGYDLFPLRHPKGVRCAVFKDGRKLKEGDKVFKTWIECQRESYQLLFDYLENV